MRRTIRCTTPTLSSTQNACKVRNVPQFGHASEGCCRTQHRSLYSMRCEEVIKAPAPVDRAPGSLIWHLARPGCCLRAHTKATPAFAVGLRTPGCGYASGECREFASPAGRTAKHTRHGAVARRRKAGARCILRCWDSRVSPSVVHLSTLKAWRGGRLGENFVDMCTCQSVGCESIGL